MGIVSGGALLLSGGGWFGMRQFQGTSREVIAEGRVFEPEEPNPLGPVPRDARFEYGRAETDRVEAARYTNFYEFSNFKWSWRLVGPFRPLPWEIEIGGLGREPLGRFAHNLHDLPWIGVPLARVLQDVDPLASATHVRFVSFNRPEEAAQQGNRTNFPWPYTEGLTIEEARIDLVLLAVGMYGEPLLKQHGAPIRLVVPWKYGFKSIKSVQRIELVDREPATFWNTVDGDSYPFQSNVDPLVPRPWPQDREYMLGSRELHDTQPYNGYGEYVAQLYG